VHNKSSFRDLGDLVAHAHADADDHVFLECGGPDFHRGAQAFDMEPDMTRAGLARTIRDSSIENRLLTRGV
jgi:hypothetical protein